MHLRRRHILCGGLLGWVVFLLGTVQFSEAAWNPETETFSPYTESVVRVTGGAVMVPNKDIALPVKTAKMLATWKAVDRAVAVVMGAGKWKILGGIALTYGLDMGGDLLERWLEEMLFGKDENGDIYMNVQQGCPNPYIVAPGATGVGAYSATMPNWSPVGHWYVNSVWPDYNSAQQACTAAKGSECGFTGTQYFSPAWSGWSMLMHEYSLKQVNIYAYSNPSNVTQCVPTYVPQVLTEQQIQDAMAASAAAGSAVGKEIAEAAVNAIAEKINEALENWPQTPNMDQPPLDTAALNKAIKELNELIGNLPDVLDDLTPDEQSMAKAVQKGVTEAAKDGWGNPIQPSEVLPEQIVETPIEEALDTIWTGIRALPIVSWLTDYTITASGSTSVLSVPNPWGNPIQIEFADYEEVWANLGQMLYAFTGLYWLLWLFRE